jgi:hypothetical protein
MPNFGLHPYNQKQKHSGLDQTQAGQIQARNASVFLMDDQDLGFRQFQVAPGAWSKLSL